MMSNRFFWILIIIAVLLRLFLAGYYPVTSDACWHANIIKYISDEWKIPFDEPLGRDFFWAPFFYHIISAIFFSFFKNDFAIKITSVLFSVGSIGLIFYITKFWFSKNHAKIATIFFAFIPLFMNLSVIVYLETTVIFFVLLTIWFCQKNRPYYAAFAIGMAAFTKYNGLVILPFFIFHFITTVKRSQWMRKGILCALIIIIIASPIFIRNFVYLENPVYPLFKSVFGGEQFGQEIKDRQASVSNLFLIPGGISSIYLDFFGVPNGSFQNFYYIPIPGIFWVILGWFSITLIISWLIILGLSKVYQNKNRLKFYFWLIPFFVLPFVFIADNGVNLGVARYAAPAFGAIAIAFALGAKPWLIDKRCMACFVIILALFASGEVLKTVVAHNAWTPYINDYQQMQDKMPMNSTVFANGQCPGFYLRRAVHQIPDTGFNPKIGDFILVNQKHQTDVLIMNEKSLNQSVKQKLVFENNRTGSQLYKLQFGFQ